MIKSVVAAGVGELSVHVAGIAKLLLDGALKKGSGLVGPDAFETYLVSSSFHASNECEVDGDGGHRIWRRCVRIDWTYSKNGSGLRRYAYLMYRMYQRSCVWSRWMVRITQFHCIMQRNRFN
jgi:hypothetical protein